MTAITPQAARETCAGQDVTVCVTPLVLNLLPCATSSRRRIWRATGSDAL